MSHLYLRGFAQRDDADPGKPLRFIIATEGRKADGIDLRMDRLDLDRFRANPVVLYGHDYWGRGSLPIGRAENIEIDGDQLSADTIFDPDDEFARQVESKYRGGFLNAVSVGFDLHGVDPDSGIPERWELIEYSAVPVPLDPEAVVASGRQRAVAMAAAITEAREGKVLSADNQQLVQDAIDQLSSLLASAGDDNDDNDGANGDGDEPRTGRSLDAVRLRVRHLEALARM